MTITAGTTANFTWDPTGLHVTITPQGGSAVTYDVPRSELWIALQYMVADDQAGNNFMRTLAAKAALVNRNVNGYAQIR